MNIRNIRKNTLDYCNLKCRSILFNIGAYLYIYPDKLNVLYEYIYKLYGNTIMFSRRSLFYSKLFYKKYHGIYLEIPPSISWNQIVILLNKNYSLFYDVFIFDIIDSYCLTDEEITFFLKTNFIKRFYCDNNVNNIVEEFIKLKEIGE